MEIIKFKMNKPPLFYLLHKTFWGLNLIFFMIDYFRHKRGHFIHFWGGPEGFIYGFVGAKPS